MSSVSVDAFGVLDCGDAAPHLRRREAAAAGGGEQQLFHLGAHS
jgi:hypothetical protein